jgi:hypothetical protein
VVRSVAGRTLATRRYGAGVGAAAAVLALAPSAAHACAVCYGKAGGDMIDGARVSVLFLLGLVYLLLLGGIAAFVMARRRRGAPAAAPHDMERGGPPGHSA